MSRKESIRTLAKDFIKFLQKEDDKANAFNSWYKKLEFDLAKQIKYELENVRSSSISNNICETN